MSGLCRVVFARGDSRDLGNSRKNQSTRVSVGIIRESALCRSTCQARTTRQFEPASVCLEASCPSSTVSGPAYGLSRRRTPDRANLLENGPLPESADGSVERR